MCGTLIWSRVYPLATHGLKCIEREKANTQVDHYLSNASNLVYYFNKRPMCIDNNMNSRNGVVLFNPNSQELSCKANTVPQAVYTNFDMK